MDLELICLISVATINAYVFLKYIRDRETSFKEYLIPDIESKGFCFISSTTCDQDESYKFSCDDISVHPFFGGQSARSDYCVYRKVLFKDEDGSHHESFACIVFDDIIFSKFRKVRWNPDLKAFQKNPPKDEERGEVYRFEKDGKTFNAVFLIAITVSVILFLLMNLIGRR